MDLDALQYFLVVAEELNISRAAKRLHMTQPPLSVHIRRLEDSLGVKLFKRSPRGVTLTPEGLTLQREARAILKRAEKAIDAVHSSVDPPTVLRVRTLAAALGDALPNILKLYSESYPGVNVHIFDDACSVEERILEGELDVAFAIQPRPLAGVTIAPICSWPLCLALSGKHRLAKMDSVPVSKLREERFVTVPQGTNHTWTEFLQELCQSAGFSPQRGMDAEHLSSALNIVSSGAAMAFVLESTRQIAPPGVLVKPLTPPTLISVGLLYRTGVQPKWIQDFIDISLAQTGQTASLGQPPASP